MKHLYILALAATLSLGANAQTRYLSTSNRTLDVNTIEGQTPAVLSRILFAGYNSICLPLTLTADQLQAAAPGVQVERMAAIRQEGSTLNLYFVDCTDEGIEAGVPYLIYSPKTQNLRTRTREAVATSSRLQPVTINDGNGNRITFSSSWESVNGGTRYGIPAKQDTEILQSILVHTEPGQTFLPTRCGFTWEQQSATATNLEVKHVMNLDAIETSINELRAADATVDVYDLAGRHAGKGRISTLGSQLTPGIYVVGGNKIAIK